MADPAADPTVVLASGSPRRLELLRRLGIEPMVRPAGIDERVLDDEGPADHVRRLAQEKAAATSAPDDALVIAADTVVVVDDDILGKPVDERQACAMLARLSDRDHEVLTGIAVRFEGRVADAVESTKVTFRSLTPAEIDAYVQTGEPADKAGAYAIQGGAGAFVLSISGSDTNVIGLPLATVVRLADEVGAPLLPR